MDAFAINRTEKLSGKIKLKGAKNSILPIIAACVLTGDEVCITDCPFLSDINDMLNIVKSMGASVAKDNATVTICCKDIDPAKIDKLTMSKIRSSIFLLGPLLARCKRAEIAMPGGCEIGARPIDLHIDGLKKLGVEIREKDGKIICAGAPKGGVIYLKYPSVGATENLMMAGVLSDGRTVICGAAKEPEIVDLAGFINTIGGRVYGAGSDLIVVEGKNKLHGALYRPITDRIAAGTFVAATALTGGDVFIEGAISDHLDAVQYAFRLAGVSIIDEKCGIRVISSGKMAAVSKLVTLPYPGFPTDMQPLMVAALCYASGRSDVTETLFESRFRFSCQLECMGAKIVRDGNAVIIDGGMLKGAEVFAQDLRGGAALTIAALKAEGESIVKEVHHIDRGYESLENSLYSIGANIKRIRAH